MTNQETTGRYALTLPPVYIASAGSTTVIDIKTCNTAESLRAATEIIVDLRNMHLGLRWKQAKVDGTMFVLIAEGEAEDGHHVSLIVHDLVVGREDEGSQAAADILVLLGFGKRDELFMQLSQPKEQCLWDVRITFGEPSS